MMITEAMKFLAMPNLEDAKIDLCRACHDLVRLLVLAGLRLVQEGGRLFGGLRFQLGFFIYLRHRLLSPKGRL